MALQLLGGSHFSQNTEVYTCLAFNLKIVCLFMCPMIISQRPLPPHFSGTLLSFFGEYSALVVLFLDHTKYPFTQARPFSRSSWDGFSALSSVLGFGIERCSHSRRGNTGKQPAGRGSSVMLLL